ncbi:hypothetical protein PF005_g28453 [Phytophthora fragariae]|uniref:RNase H type-1 domain-containing protein n=1 Tax=Phytophthora fragariae TaxID=53985 RepID=A0A6A3Q0A1_9STRA|nr:hypothetical protein PF003_g20297 [Phytophthora fragariae]KAE8920555.1 hypothetical protein PF009_g29152 [Phytophthora fragariae]KAE8969082.1 hypothetical protein PF011_g26942 [Phytophthora fragariae]KAE9065501.1 hypothetical protein PF010_g28173 [Phytophthora fragariae]KAE9066302.1 hypothetical protein PF007_g28523 [Phytophthora fragariae]
MERDMALLPEVSFTADVKIGDVQVGMPKSSSPEEDTRQRHRPTKIIMIPTPRLQNGETLHVLSFDGSAKPKREGGAFEAVLWEVPGWEVVKAASGYDTDLTVNEAEYRGLLLGCELLHNEDVKRLIVCGDSNLVIRQIREEMDCKSPGLVLLRGRVWKALEKWPEREFFHVRRNWNASADLLAGQALQRQAGLLIQHTNDLEDLRMLNRLPEVLQPQASDPDVNSVDRTGPEVDPIRSTLDRAGTEVDPTRSKTSLDGHSVTPVAEVVAEKRLRSGTSSHLGSASSYRRGGCGVVSRDGFGVVPLAPSWNPIAWQTPVSSGRP